eukprot:TRINITY_DN11237_c0_g1_i4.p1 TRINITY_DN11237_c0_g1~~TRINITY_DN11237_c0_g1_i4.p1  ORF type:complete len:454 (-),score=105.41 TRINITY_DN11237_c0_g1_i4:20-1381(-)
MGRTNLLKIRRIMSLILHDRTNQIPPTNSINVDEVGIDEIKRLRADYEICRLRKAEISNQLKSLDKSIYQKRKTISTLYKKVQFNSRKGHQQLQKLKSSVKSYVNRQAADFITISFVEEKGRYDHLIEVHSSLVKKTEELLHLTKSGSKETRNLNPSKSLTAAEQLIAVEEKISCTEEGLKMWEEDVRSQAREQEERVLLIEEFDILLSSYKSQYPRDFDLASRERRLEMRVKHFANEQYNLEHHKGMLRQKLARVEESIKESRARYEFCERVCDNFQVDIAQISECSTTDELRKLEGYFRHVLDERGFSAFEDLANALDIEFNERVKSFPIYTSSDNLQVVKQFERICLQEIEYLLSTHKAENQIVKNLDSLNEQLRRTTIPGRRKVAQRNEVEKLEKDLRTLKECVEKRLAEFAAARQNLLEKPGSVSYTHLRAHETGRNLVCRLLLEKKK